MTCESFSVVLCAFDFSVGSYVNMSLLSIPQIVMSTKSVQKKDGEEQEECLEAAPSDSLKVKKRGFYMSSPEIRCSPSPCIFDFEGNRGTAIVDLFP